MPRPRSTRVATDAKRLQERRHHLSHLDADGHARMVDVGDKPETTREAVAEGRITMARATVRAITAGTLPKGDVLATARIAGIQAAKRTAELIPLCHPLRLTKVEVELRPRPTAGAVTIQARVRAHDRTGVEMEALTAVATAALTIYDMCKGLDRGMVIEQVQLLEKRGGRSGTWRRPRR